MLMFFKRLIGRAPASTYRPKGKRRNPADAAEPIVGEPIPVPEVVEGNGGESDWNLWQDSVLTSESNLQPLAPMDGGHDKTQPMSTKELNGYAKPRTRGSA